MSRAEYLGNKGEREEEKAFLTCESYWVFVLLMLCGGYFGGYTYNVRGGIFCNAQTANLLLIALHLGNGNIPAALRHFFPFIAYMAGILVSEHFGEYFKGSHVLRFETGFVFIEMVLVFILGALPGSYPDVICQLGVNFITAMQFNVFRQAEGVGMATTFCTNHIRQMGVNLYQYFYTHQPKKKQLFLRHSGMVLSFAGGVLASTVISRYIPYQSLWGACLILLVIFMKLLLADRGEEKKLLERRPRGH